MTLVVAKEKGHFGGKFIEEGIEFYVPDDLPDADFTWFERVDESDRPAPRLKNGKGNGGKGGAPAPLA